MQSMISKTQYPDMLTLFDRGIPNEILLDIVDFLPLQSKISLSLTCRTWFNLVGLGPLRSLFPANKHNPRLHIRDIWPLLEYLDQHFPNHGFCHDHGKWHKMVGAKTDTPFSQWMTSFFGQGEICSKLLPFNLTREKLDVIKIYGHRQGPMWIDFVSRMIMRAHRMGPEYGIRVHDLLQQPYLLQSPYNLHRSQPKIVHDRLYAKCESFMVGINYQRNGIWEAKVISEQFPPMLWPGPLGCKRCSFRDIMSAFRWHCETHQPQSNWNLHKFGQIFRCQSCSINSTDSVQRLDDYDREVQQMLLPEHTRFHADWILVLKMTKWIDLGECRQFPPKEVTELSSGFSTGPEAGFKLHRRHCINSKVERIREIFEVEM